MKTLGGVLKEYGFDKDICDVYDNILMGMKYGREDVDDDVMNRLIVLRMATLVLDMVIPIDPKATILGWINELKWSIEERNIKHELSPLIYFPKSLDIDSLLNLYNNIESLEFIVEDFEDIIIAENESQTTAYICSSIINVSEIVRALAIDTAFTNTSSVWGIISNKIDKGVKYQRICDYSEVLLHGLKIKKSDILLGVELYVVNPDFISEKFYLFDNEKVFIFEGVTDLFYKDSGQLISSDYIAGIYMDKFNEVLRVAKPGIDIIDEWSVCFNDLASLLDRRSKAIYKSIVEYGVFSEYQKESCDEIKIMIEKGYLEQKKRGESEFVVPSIKSIGYGN